MLLECPAEVAGIGKMPFLGNFLDSVFARPQVLFSSIQSETQFINGKRHPAEIPEKLVKVAFTQCAALGRFRRRKRHFFSSGEHFKSREKFFVMVEFVEVLIAGQCGDIADKFHDPEPEFLALFLPIRTT